MARASQQGVVVCFARKGIVVMHEAFGRLRPGSDSPSLPVDALFPIASITKVLTATAVMVLVEEGRLGLHVPVQYYIHELTGDGKEGVTTYHLLTHTSGLREEEVEKFAEQAKGTVPAAPAEATLHPAMARRLSERYSAPLSRKPGSEFSYCNLNLDLAGEIVRRISGMSLEDFAQQRVFGPLGMRDTHFGLAGPWAQRLVEYPADHLFAPLLADRDIRDMGAPSGHGISSAMDLAILGQMHLNGGSYGEARVLSSPSVRAMTTNRVSGVGFPRGDELRRDGAWGLGWSVKGEASNEGDGDCELLTSPRAFDHGGAGGVVLWVDPDNDVVGVYLTVQPLGAPSGDFAGAGLFVNSMMAAIESA